MVKNGGKMWGMPKKRDANSDSMDAINARLRDKGKSPSGSTLDDLIARAELARAESQLTIEALKKLRAEIAREKEESKTQSK
jgi:hypothetical protein